MTESTSFTQKFYKILEMIAISTRYIVAFI